MSEELLYALWQAVDRAAQLQAELQETAEQLAAWRSIAEAAMQVLDRRIATRDGRSTND